MLGIFKTHLRSLALRKRFVLCAAGLFCAANIAVAVAATSSSGVTLSVLVSHFGQSGQTQANGDLDGDGKVTVFDLSLLLTELGSGGTGIMCTATPASGSNLQIVVDNASAGDTICLPANSVFNGGLTLEQSSGVSNSPITITSLDHTRPATINGRIVTKPGGNYFTFSWLHLVGVNNGNLPSITIGSDHTSLLNNDITNNHTTICINDIDDPTYGTAHYTTIDRNRIHNCGILPAANGDHGIYEIGYNALITNNYIYANADRGIQLRGAKSAVVKHNIVDGNGEGVIFGDLGASNNLVDHNIFSNSNQRFNAESYWGSQAVGTGNVFSNNCSWTTASGFYGSNQGVDPSISGVSVSGTLFANPLYVNAAAHDYTLQAGSPCAAMAPQ
ncbi:MAG: hypothetical protein JWL89_498 [Candidatus Saccharibacteria bacterium]|nr:hypothetical protein [Candidatus Saccharibacteria bacterium]